MPPVGTDAAGLTVAPEVDDHRATPDRARERVADCRWLVVGGVAALVVLPLLVAVVTLRRPHWYPAIDLAMTELRLRDVGGRHTPLIGLPGRIGDYLVNQGSHPGPLSFYLLAPFYRLFGSSAWAMQAATVVLDVAAVALALVIAARRGGTRLVVAMGAVLAALVVGYGLTTLTQPWNPYLPLLWWIVLLLAVWSVLCGDVILLPLVVFVGTLCAQTHVAYVGLALGLGALAAGGLALAGRRAPPGSAERRRIRRLGAASLALGVALWIPPLVDQAVNDPGNLRALYDHFVTPPEDPVGYVRGAELMLRHLDLGGAIGEAQGSGTLLAASSRTGGSLVPGLVLLAAWAVAAWAARRHGPPALARLHLVIGAGLVSGAASLGRIFGREWYYLMLWAWALGALVVVAVAWTAAAVVIERWPRRRAVATTAGTLAAALIVAGLVGVGTGEALTVEAPEPHLSERLAATVAPTIGALERGEGAATGRAGRYEVSSSDAFYFGSLAYGMVNELERAGFDVGMGEAWRVPVTRHRVLRPDEVTAVVVVATGDNVERWRENPAAVEVARLAPDADQRADFARRRSALVADLRDAGLDDLVPLVDTNLFGVRADARISADIDRSVQGMLELAGPVAVFIAPPGATL